MQNVGQPFGQGGGAPSHQGAAYGHPESSTTSGSITSSLRQFRKKDVEKQQVSDSAPTVAESHVARVAPHNHYPPRSQDCFRYPSQFPDFSLPTQVKYSEISEHQPLQDQITPSVIQKAKSKEYMEMCNVAQTHMKQSYPEHLNTQQPYAPDPSLHPHAQYLPKDPQVHPSYKPESQYYPKENQYQQQLQMQKYNMAAQMRKYPTENDFLSKLRRIHPTMARSIMSDHHLQESQSSYQAMDQNRKFPHQNQRYMNYPSGPMQSNPYPHGYMPPQPYPNYPSSCSYTRNPQMPPRFPSTNPHERSVSPRRGYVENLPIPPINYTAVPQRISPNYGQYNPSDYAQHYQQHRRPTPQDYFSQPYRTAQYLPHQMVQQEMTENRVTVSDSIKQYIENWADEETATEMNQIEANRLCKENLRIREESSTETVYMINASELQYLENGMPLVASENGIPLVTSENGQYFLKTLDSNTLGMVKIVEKTNQVETSEGPADRIVNLHIMDPLKPDCMMSGKPNELNQRQSNTSEKSRVVIHQNTVIQPGLTTQQCQPPVDSSLPMLVENEVSEDMNHLEKLAENVFRECKKETVDKNCSPINMEHLDNMDDFNYGTSVICPLKLLEHQDEETKEENSNGIDPKLKNMPIIDLLPDCLQNVPEENQFTDEKPSSFHVDQKEEKQDSTVPEHDAIGLIVENTDDGNFSNKDETIKNEDAEVKNSTNYNAFKEIKTTEEKVENDINQRCKNIEITKTETKEELITDCTKDVTNEELISGKDIEEKEVLRNDVPECKVEAVKTDTKDNEISNTEETKCTFEKSDPVEEKKSTDLLVSRQTYTNEASEAKENETLQKNSTTDTHCSEENVNKNATRRTKRIFSVDDIINNIGNHKNKSRANNHLSERRHSLQITREFLEREIDTSYLFCRKCPPISESCTDNTKEESEEVMKNMEQHAVKVEEVIPKEEIVEKSKEEKFNVTVEEPLDIINKELSTERTIDENTEAMDINEKTLRENQRNDESEKVEVADKQSTESKTIHANKIKETYSEEQVTISQNEAVEIAVKARQDSLEFYNKENTEIEQKSSQNGVEEKQFCPVDVADNTISCTMKEHEVISEETNSCKNSIEISDLNIKETTTDSTSQNEVQYRNAIRVEENSVLLEIAGELVDITVNVINGKKVITVLPLSESTVVDFNDNYETLDITKEETIRDPIETNCINDEQVSQMFPEEEAHSEPDVIESTSEIIIGLDISLEEEIKLDLETPRSMSPKVTKKTYENDLQIPSITTSEDVTDNNKAKSYSPNDKVSSSKEQTSERFENEKKASNSVRKSLKKKLNPSESVVKESLKARKVKKDVARHNKEKTGEADEEEFIPFRDLIKARKLKKIKQQQMKTDDNVSADSTNRLDQEECSETESESKLKECEVKSEEVKDKRLSKEDTIEHIGHVKRDKSEEVSEESKSKDTSLDYQIEIDMEKLPKLDEIQKYKDIQFKDTEDKVDKLNRSNELSEKVRKKVTFGNVSYDKPQKSTFDAKKVEDPRLKSSPSGGILLPSVSELLKEHDRLPNKKKLSLAEYNSRKRKPIVSDDDKDAKMRKAEPPPEPITIKIDMKRPKEQPCSRFKMQRPKSLDDIKIFGKPKEYTQIKRKFSLEVTSSKPNCFDWEETQSPKTNTTPTEETQKRLSEFRGLINNNKSKIIVAVGSSKPTSMGSSEDEILQNYKEQVDSKLSSLNLQIPRAKPPTNISNPFSSAETTSLMQRFLKNEKLSMEEMDKIKKIISYKRLMQQLDRIQSPALNSPLNPSYEIRNCVEKEMKLHLKKVPEKKKKRFRNLYTESTSETDSDFSDSKRANGDYSVVQSNCYAAGVPKLIIKRKTEVPVPVVRLERLDMKVLTTRKRKFC